MTDSNIRSTNNTESPADEKRNWIVYVVVLGCSAVAACSALICLAGFLYFLCWYKGKSRRVHIGLTFVST